MNIYWSRFIADLVEKSAYTQKQFATILGTSQQCVSKWSNGQGPGEKYQKKIIKLALKQGLCPYDYKLGKKDLRLTSKSKRLKSLPKDVKSLVRRLMDMPVRQRNKTISLISEMINIAERE